ncbi:hypothetical protein [Neobacillus citreus]|uniref:Uncharacterized protein n=1 Tax=Neobacillus citreus TaxID=2833578 RepID=A0A942SV14_9BACI|nr:hypothetical protein [Neobacillus citreus]MCH6263917.1 hypothetical protein [Neobacillus citreus]
MLSYITLALLIVNFIVLVTVYTKGKSRGEEGANQQLEQKILDIERRITHELSELKMTIGQVQLKLKLKEKGLTTNKRAENPPEPSHKTVELQVSKDNYTKEILKLKERGLTGEQIARKLKMEYEEVSYILEFAARNT